VFYYIAFKTKKRNKTNESGIAAQKGTSLLMKRFISFLLAGWLCLALATCGVNAPNQPHNETVTAHDDDPPPPPPPPPDGGGGG
jgi:hypothetical protein